MVAVALSALTRHLLNELCAPDPKSSQLPARNQHAVSAAADCKPVSRYYKLAPVEPAASSPAIAALNPLWKSVLWEGIYLAKGSHCKGVFNHFIGNPDFFQEYRYVLQLTFTSRHASLGCTVHLREYMHILVYLH